jgi:hypothetical protein
MKHQSTARYPVSAEVVLRMFADQAFQTRKLDAMGLPKYRVLDYQFDGKRSSIRIERKMELKMPGLGLMKKATVAEQTFINEESWDIPGRKGTVKVTVQSMPVEMACKVSAVDEGGGCVLTYDWDVHAKIPVVGGTLEKFVCGDIDKRAGDEAKAAMSLLPDYR